MTGDGLIALIVGQDLGGAPGTFAARGPEHWRRVIRTSGPNDEFLMSENCIEVQQGWPRQR